MSTDLFATRGVLLSGTPPRHEFEHMRVHARGQIRVHWPDPEPTRRKEHLMTRIAQLVAIAAVPALLIAASGSVVANGGGGGGGGGGAGGGAGMGGGLGGGGASGVGGGHGGGLGVGGLDVGGPGHGGAGHGSAV